MVKSAYIKQLPDKSKAVTDTMELHRPVHKLFLLKTENVTVPSGHRAGDVAESVGAYSQAALSVN